MEFALLAFRGLALEASLSSQLAIGALFLACALLWEPRCLSPGSSSSGSRQQLGIKCALAYALAAGLAYALAPGHPERLLSTYLEDLPLLFVLALWIPFCEEAYFRGALQPAFVRREGLPPWGAIYLSALVFWLFHAPLAPVEWSHAWAQGGLPLAPGPFFLGLACAWIRARDGHIWGAVALHGLANACGPLWEPLLRSAGAWEWFYRQGY